MKYLIAAALLAALTALHSCKKSEDAGTAPSAVINISSPSLNQEYHNGDTVKIAATINGTTTLHGCDITIVNMTTGDSVFQAAQHAHAAVLHVDATWEASVSSAADLRLIVSCAVNHDGLEVVRSVDFKAHP